ncbi:MAG: penicillin-binding protein 2 [Eubacterium sp.]|nr:penicillin-binding protein 2 [Eubacterium sp.]
MTTSNDRNREAARRERRRRLEKKHREQKRRFEQRRKDNEKALNQRREVKRGQRRISRRFTRKFAAVFAIIIVAMMGLALRITYINVKEGTNYKEIVMTRNQQKYGSRTIPFQRGNITDRNGTVLATSQKVYNVILDCKMTNTSFANTDGSKETPYIEPTLKALKEVMGLSEEKMKKLLEDDDTKDSQYQIVKKGVSITVKQKFEAYTDTESKEYEALSDEEKRDRANVVGVWFEEDYEREYPLKSLACDVIGFTYDGTTADWGIEGEYSSVLNGTNGRRYGYYNSDNDVEQQIVPAEPGSNVVSTIDVNIQQIVRSAINDLVEQLKDGPYYENKGAENIGVLVMNPNNGEILAMDSSDWYDLNDPRNLKGHYKDEEIEAMDNADMMDALNAMWQNFCITGAYEPGSVVKPMTSAAALETGAITPETQFTCGGIMTVADREIKCDVYPSMHGTLDLAHGLAYSCNVYYMNAAARLGKEEFLKYQNIFNLGEYTGIDLPGENPGMLYNVDTMGPVELATCSFGQGFTLNMVQEAAAISSIINGGNYYKPHVVKAITNADGSVEQEISPILEKHTVSKEVSDVIREDMGLVVTEGTGKGAKVEGYSMGGKTGTAETLPREDEMLLTSFIGFAPLDDPQVLVYVVVDKPNAYDQENHSYPNTLAKTVMAEVLQYMNIYPDEAVEDDGSGTTDAAAGADTAGGTDTAAGADTAGGTDTAAGTGTAAGTDTAAGTGTAYGTDTAYGTGTAYSTGTAAGTN